MITQSTKFISKVEALRQIKDMGHRLRKANDYEVLEYHAYQVFEPFYLGMVDSAFSGAQGHTGDWVAINCESGHLSILTEAVVRDNYVRIPIPQGACNPVPEVP